MRAPATRAGARAWVAAFTVAFAAAATGADGRITTAGSTLIATFMQQHAPVDAPFKVFSGSVDYDAAHPESTRATLRVDVGSLELGDADASAELRKPAWFDTARYPEASFRSTSARRAADGRLEVTGTLEIKGRAQPVTVAVSVQSSGATRSFDGSFELSRKAFGIGDPAWDGVLDDNVRLRFHLQAAGG